MMTVETQTKGQDMKFQTMHADGKKSTDAKIRKLVKYVNDTIAEPNLWRRDGVTDEDACAEWAQKTIEQGVRNIASGVFADRID